MITSEIALWTLEILALVLIILIPILDSIKKLSDFISLRWTCIAVVLLLMVGVVIDFGHLADSSRDIVLKGGLIIVGVYLILRTIEKVLFNGWLKGINLKGSVSKGDTTATIEVKQDKEPEVSISSEEKEEEPKEELKESKEEDK